MARLDASSIDPEWSVRFQLEAEPALFESHSPLDGFRRQEPGWTARARPIRKKVTRKIRNSLPAPYRLWIR
jgi:hypothetical protein